jgi:hypothetical protein
VFDKICLINRAVYIAYEHTHGWEATGAQFAIPYVFKTLFSGEKVIFSDLQEVKSVTSGAMYLDFNEDNEEEHHRQFIGRVSSFIPIKPGCGGGLLVREQGDKFNAVTGTKGYRWMEFSTVMSLPKKEDIVDWKEIRHYVPLSSDCFESVFLGVNMLPRYRTKIIDIANKLNPNIKIYQMTLDSEAFRLKGEAVNL